MHSDGKMEYLSSLTLRYSDSDSAVSLMYIEFATFPHIQVRAATIEARHATMHKLFAPGYW